MWIAPLAYGKALVSRICRLDFVIRSLFGRVYACVMGIMSWWLVYLYSRRGVFLRME
jgi:hypothetical protein